MLGFLKDLLLRINAAGDEDLLSAETLVNSYKREVIDRRIRIENESDVATVEFGQRILNAPAEQRARILTIAFSELCGTVRPYLGGKRYLRYTALLKLVSRLLRANLPLRPYDLEHMLRQTCLMTNPAMIPITGLIRTVERYGENATLSVSIVNALEQILRHAERKRQVQLEKLAPRLRKLLGITTTRPLFAGGRFAAIATHWFKPQDQHVVENWMPLIRHANTLGNKNRPAIRWLKESERLIHPIGEVAFCRALESWLADFEPDPERPDPDANLIKALIFMAG